MNVYNPLLNYIHINKNNRWKEPCHASFETAAPRFYTHLRG